jgi:uncharacterized SAM-binding protein YcdF (DUF218 family)
MAGAVVLIIFYSLSSEGLIYLLSRRKKLQEVHYILVLGNKGGPASLVTQDRVKKAILAKQKFPHAKIILTGNEHLQEVTTFKNLLRQEGIQEYIEEKMSQTTWDNMRNSLSLMKDLRGKGKTESPGVLVVTSQYHQSRSIAMARSLGMNAERFGRDFFTYEKAKKFFVKERLSNLIYSPQILWNCFKKLF